MTDAATIRRAPARIEDAELPVYTLLVPLYREANMLGGLTRALSRLDYPAAKLDVKLILEAVDAETIAAARALDLPGNVEILVVPDLHPRTKPKALNYALPLARGDYLVIYDAEDRPERDQLRKGAAAFRQGPPNLACLQAKLNLYNADDNWLTRQFTIEYGALFDGLLPALDRLRLPIPLGGTSNHFRVAALKWLMAWDPFNVTEDADLGHEARAERLSLPGALVHHLRGGAGQVRLLASPAHALDQGLYADLARAYAATRESCGASSALPGFSASRSWSEARCCRRSCIPGSTRSQPSILPTTPSSTQPALLGLPVWLIASLSLGAGYLASMAVAFLALKQRGARQLFKQVPLMPLYWLLISGAAYRAIWQFMTDRFAWEKTEHGVSRSMTKAAAP